MKRMKIFISLGVWCVFLGLHVVEAAEATLVGTRTVLDNGAVLLVAERPGVPMVVMNMFIKTGSTADPIGKAGVASLTSELLLRGTQKYTADALAEALDFLGTSLSVSADYETTSVSLTTLTKNLDASFALLAEVLLRPTFPADEFERKRTETLGGLQSQEENPGWVSGKAFQEKLYASHPFGRLVEGQPSTLANIKQADITNFYQTYFRPNNTIIGMAGEISPTQAAQLIAQHLGGWQQGAVPQINWPAAPQPVAEQLLIDKQVSQANVILGHPGVSRLNPDFYAIRVMNYILGSSGFGSRLMERIREELALVYSIRSSFSARKHAGPFRVVLQTKNTTAKQAIDECIVILQQFMEKGVTQKELDAAKSYLINSYPLGLVSNRDFAGLLPALEFFELGLDYPQRYPKMIAAISLEQVQAAAKKYLHPDKLLQVVVANLEQAQLTPAQEAAPAEAAAEPAQSAQPQQEQL
jgi:zinc protease